MQYLFEGNSKFVIVNGKVYPVKKDGKTKVVEIPDDVEVKEKFLTPLSDKEAVVEEETQKEVRKKK